MNYKDLAELLYPNVKSDIKALEEKYPERKLDEGAEVCRFAPSPTGRMHMGNLFASFIPEVIAKQTNGVFILRIEDTDEKRAIENGVELILNDLENFNYIVDEHPIKGGEYGPYIQTERAEIYHTVAKYLVSIGRAYPCFCSSEDLTEMRTKQEEKKDRIGYYGKYAKCRNLSFEEVKARIENGDKWVLRLKSMGDFNKKFVFNDLVKGSIELPENDIDQVLIKSDGIPPYAFAHVCDDHFMRVTTVTRDDSYISSVPYHLEIWNACGFEAPKFAHLLPLNKKEGETIRKISKRKDPEAAVAFYHEKGIPNEAIKLYFATIMNSNFEEWFLENQDKTYREFKFSFDKMSTSGSLFDLEKLMNISKVYFSKLSASEIYERVLNYTKQYDLEFYELIKDRKEYLTALLNIEREVERPRMDIGSYSDVKKEFWYMFDELFNKKDNPYEDINYSYDISFIKAYFENIYSENDSEEEWFNKVKEYASSQNFAINRKEYKEDPTKFLGNLADFCSIIRVMLTTSNMSPNMYDLLKIYGRENLLKRIDVFLSAVNN